MFFADGSGEKSEGKRAVLGPVFRLESGKTAGFRGKKRIFPVIFRGSHDMGEFWLCAFQAALIPNGL